MLLLYSRLAARLVTRTVFKHYQFGLTVLKQEQSSNVNKAIHVQQCTAPSKTKNKAGIQIFVKTQNTSRNTKTMLGLKSYARTQKSSLLLHLPLVK